MRDDRRTWPTWFLVGFLALMMLGLLGCAMAGSPDPVEGPEPAEGPVTVQVDVRFFGTGNLYLFDYRTGRVVERFHNIANGRSVLHVDFEAIRGREVGFAWDTHGRRTPYVIGQPGTVYTLVLENPELVVCVTIANHLPQSSLSLGTCA